MRRGSSGWIAGSAALAAALLLAVFAGAAPAAPPANDSFANAQVVSGETGSTSGNNLEATAEPGEPSHTGWDAAYSVWYRWTAPYTGKVAFETGGNYVGIGVHTGSAVNALTWVASNYGYGSLQSSKVVFSVTAGTVYRVAVDSAYSERGPFTLSWRRVHPPTNDLFANAETITGLSGTRQGTTFGAGTEAGEPNHDGYPRASIWYRWVPQFDGYVRIDDAGSAYDNVLALYRGTALTALTKLDYNRGWSIPSIVESEVTAGQTYYIVVDSADWPGDVTLNWRVRPPANDDFDAPESLWADGGGGSLSGVNAAATKQLGEPNHAGDAGGHSVWFKWQSLPGTVTVQTAGSDFATVLAAYTGTAVTSLATVASGGSSLTFHADGGVPYAIALDGAGGASGNYRLTWSFRPDPPANDDFAAAQLISLEKNWIKGRTIGATKQAGEPDHGGNPGGRSVWYRWIAPKDGLAVFDTFDIEPRSSYWHDTDYDSTLAVYRGATLETLTLVAGNDDHGWGWWSRVAFPVEKGEEYRIAVDGHGASNGSLALNWNVGPPNDDFAFRQVISGPRGAVTGTTAASTWEGLDGGAVEDRDDPATVWFLWRAPASGDVRFEVAASSYRPGLGVWTGPNYATLHPVRTVGQVQEKSVWVKFPAEAGRVYRVEVLGDAFGPFTLSWEPTTIPPPPWPARPANDDFASAQTIAGESGSVTGTNENATDEAEEPEHDPYEWNAYSVWYSWTAPFTGTALFETAGSDFTTVLAVYGGDRIERVRRIGSASGTQPLRVGVTAGTTYSIAVAGATRYDPLGTIILGWRRHAAAPANDGFAGRTPLSGGTGTVDFTTAEASAELDEPWHGDKRPNASLWWTWTAPATGPTSFQTALGALDTRIGVYSGATRVATNDESANGGSEARVVFQAQAGTTYAVAVDSAGRGAGTLSWRMPPSPANDAFANAMPLPLAFYSINRFLLDDADSIGASREPAEPVHAGVAGGASVWYSVRWDYGTQTLALSTLGSEFDTVVGVYTGSSVGGLTQVAANDDSATGSHSFLTFTAVGSYSNPTTYWIAVDGKGGQTGRLRLTLNPVEGPPNDHFHAATPIAGASGSVTGTVLRAGIQHGEPTPGGFSSPGGSIWYRWTAPATGTWRFDVQNSAVWLTFGVYSGDRVGTLVEHASTDDEWRLYVPVEAGRTYSILINGDDDDPDPVYLNWRPATAPAHDRFAAAQTLDGASGTVSASTSEASREVAEPRIALSAGGASLWYRWTAPFTGTVAFDAAGTPFDAVLGVYTGSALTNLVPVAQNDDFAGELVPSVRFEAVAGTTYFVSIDGSSWSTDFVPRGDATLNWILAPPPANDRFANAQGLTGSSGSVGGTTVGARSEPGEPPHSDRAAGATVWYAWTAPADGSYRLDASGSDFPVVVGVYRGAGVDALEVVRRSDDLGGRVETLTFAATSGTTYRLAVDGHIRATGAVLLAWAPLPPPNDAFTAAEQIAGRNGNALAVTRGATSEAGEPSHAGLPPRASVWFRWRAPATEAVTFDTYGSDFDTILAVYTGNELGALTNAGSSDDALRLEVTEGTVYRIAVDGKSGATGNVVLNWFPTPTPPNDDFANAELIGGRTGWIHPTTFGATRESGEPDHAGAGGTHSVWYRFKAPASGTLTLWTEDTWFDTVLAAYTGTTPAALTEVGRDDDSGGTWNGYGASRLTLAVSRGSVYWVAVDGKAGSFGAFLLRWRLPPANDPFGGAQALSGESGSVVGTTLAATPEAGWPPDADPAVWYRWTAPTTGTYVFDAAAPGGGEPPSVGVYAGTAPADLVSGGTWIDPGRFGATGGTTYFVAVRPEWVGDAGEFTLSWRRDADAPANDNVTTAAPISGSSGRASGVVLGASREPGEPPHGEVGFSVWHRWTAPASGTVHLNTEGTTYDSNVALYTGTSVGSLTAVPSERQTTGGFPSYSHLRASVTAGASYLIAVDGVAALGSYVLRYDLNPPTAPIDSPYTKISAGPAGVVSTRDASFSFGSSNPATFQCRLDGGALVGCSSPTSYAGLGVGTHTFEVKGTNAAASEAVPARRTWRIAAPPPNDAFVAASVVTGLVGDTVGTFNGATREAGEPDHAARPYDRSVWYRWTAPRDGIATVAVTWSSIREPLLGVYTGTSVGGLTGAPGILPPGGDPSADRVLFRASAGTTYSFAVANSYSGSFRLRWRLAPPNDDRRNAFLLSGESGSWSGDNVGATREAGEARHGGDGGGASIWFRWTAPSTGTLTLDTATSEATIDTTLGVYTASPYPNWLVDGPVPRASDDDSAGSGKSRISLEVFEGTAYEIAVDGFDGATGGVVLRWSFSAPVAATPPTVALTSPADGSLVREDVSLAATASDPDGIERVEFLVNGSVVAVDGSEPYATTWDSTSIANGPAVVRARAVDFSTASTVSAPRSITVDNAPPDTLLDEGPTGTTSSREATFRFHSDDASAGFECALDTAPFAPCSSPQSYSSLGAGDHFFQVRAVDAAGNRDPSPVLREWTVNATDHVLLAAGDIAGCGWSGDEATASILDDHPDATIAALGDLAYDNGAATEFQDCYGPTWGRHKARTKPAAGNHDYATPGAGGYFGYFGAGAGEATKGYYSYDLGAWHVVVLNSNCAAVSCATGSLQEQWLRADLAASQAACTLAYWHHPLFTSGDHAGEPDLQLVRPLWEALYADGADLILVGHDHDYERFAPQTPAGVADAAYGIRQIVVGTGGAPLRAFGPAAANSEVRNASTYGVLRVSLRAAGYDWSFVPVAGSTFTDSGTASCHDAPDLDPPSPNPTIASSHSSSWSNDRTVDVTWSGASDAGSGVDGFSYEWSQSAATVPDQVKDAEETAASATSPPLADGSWWFHLRTRDNAGNWSGAAHLGPFRIDTVAPVTTDDAPAAWRNGNVTVALSSTDDRSGVAATHYSVDGGVFTAGTSVGLAAEGVHTIQYRSTDAAGNVETTRAATVRIDKTPAATTDNAPAGWRNGGVTVTLSAADALSGIAATQYALDGAAFVTGTNVTVAGDGVHSLAYRTTDVAGNVESLRSATVRIDGTAPTNPTLASSSHAVGAWSNDPTVELSWSGAADGVSGVDGYSYEWSQTSSSAPDETKDVTATNGPRTEGSWWFHLRTVDAAGNWSGAVHLGPFRIDTTAPENPGLASPSHTVGAWSNDPTVDVIWPGAADGGSGVDGYSFEWTQTAASSPDATKDTWSGPPSLADGSWWFHLRTVDAAGNWSDPVHVGPFRIDTTPPASPTLSSSHAPGDWSNDATVDVTWNGATDAGSGVGGYSYEWSQSASTTPDGAHEPDGTSTTSPALADGDWWFHLRTVDTAGNWSATVRRGPFRIDTTAPANPVLSSPSHQTGAWSNQRSVAVEWSGGAESYSHAWSREEATIPDDQADSAETRTEEDLADGAWWFHVKAYEAGSWSGTTHLGPFLIDTTPPETFLAGLAFSASEPATFRCSLDGGPYAACESPAGYGNLPPGEHVFRVFAVDRAGNADASPGEHRWVVAAPPAPPPPPPPAPPVPPPAPPPPQPPPAPPPPPKPPAAAPKKVTICFKRRTLKVPKKQLTKYRKKGAKLGRCKRPVRRRGR